MISFNIFQIYIGTKFFYIKNTLHCHAMYTYLKQPDEHESNKTEMNFNSEFNIISKMDPMSAQAILSKHSQIENNLIS